MSVLEVFETPDDAGQPNLILVESQQHYNRLGATAEVGAHFLSVLRGVGGIALAHEIDKNEDYQTWKNAAIFGALALTDWADGALSRWGRKRQSKDESVRRPFNSYIDLFGDNALVNPVTAAIARREAKNGNPVYAKVVGTTSTIYNARAVATTTDRLIADVQGIKTNALPGNKLTSLKQDVVIAAALTPLAKSKSAKALLGTAFAYTAREKVLGGINMHEHFQKQRTERKKKSPATVY